MPRGVLDLHDKSNPTAVQRRPLRKRRKHNKNKIPAYCTVQFHENIFLHIQRKPVADQVWRDNSVASRNRWLEYQGKRVAQQKRWLSDLQDVNHEGTMAKAPPCPERRMRMLLPQQSSSSTREEESQWSVQERTVIASQEKAGKKSRGTEVEDKRKRCVAFEDAARRMQKYLEDSEDLKVGLSELKEQLEMPEAVGFSIMQIAQQARNEKGEKLFETFRREENEVYIASLARWDTQLNGLMELERRCQDLMQGVKLPSEREQITRG